MLHFFSLFNQTSTCKIDAKYTIHSLRRKKITRKKITSEQYTIKEEIIIIWIGLWILVLSTHLNDQPTNDRDMQHLYRAVRYPSIHEDCTHTHTSIRSAQHSNMHTHHSYKHTYMKCYALVRSTNRTNENGSINVCECAKWISFLAHKISK